MGACAYPASRLRVLSSVGVEVSVSNGGHNTKAVAIGVDSFDMLASVTVQRVAVVTPAWASGVQTCNKLGLLVDFNLLLSTTLSRNINLQNTDQ